MGRDLGKTARRFRPGKAAFAILCFLHASAGFADHDFTYKNVIACGPEVVTNIPPGYAGRNYVVILDDENSDHFAIVSGNAEYSSFKRMHYSELYVQRGGETWLEFEKLGDGSIRFELHKDEARFQKFVTFITFNMAWLAADLEYSWKDEKMSLVCWKYKNNA